MSRTRRYLMGLGSGYVVTFATILVGLFLTPFTLRFLDREEYAVFILAGDILMWLGLLDIGITAGLNVQAAQLTATPDEERLNRLASTAFFAQLVLVLAVLIVGAAIVFGFPHFFSIRSALRKDAAMMMIIMVISSALALGLRTYSALLVAHQQIHIDNLLRLGLLFVRTILTVVLLVWGFKLLSLAWAYLAATAITSALAVMRAYRVIPSLKIKLAYFSKETLLNTGGLGLWFSLGGLTGLLIENVDRIVAAKLISLESAAILSLTGRLYALSYGLLQQLSNTARPMLGQMFGEGKSEQAFKRYKQIFQLSTGSAIVVAAGIWAGNGSFIRWWVGPMNYGGAALDFALALNLIVHLWVLPNRAVLSSAMIVRPQTISRLVEGALNVSLSIVLAYRFGLFGILIATTLSALLTSCWVLPLLTARLFQRSLKRVLWDDMARMILLLLIISPTAYVLRFLSSHIAGFEGAAVGMIVSGGVGIFLLWYVIFDRNLKEQLLRIASFARSVRS